MPKIHYLTDGRTIEIGCDTTLLRASLDHGTAHTHVCGGNAKCSTCRVLPRLVHSRFGLHVVEVLEREPGVAQPFESVRGSVAMSLRQPTFVTALRQFLRLLAGTASPCCSTASMLSVLKPAWSMREGEETFAVPETAYPTLEALLAAVRACRACEAHLPLGPRPVLRAGETARILIVGQAPGARVHATGVPWDDLSGERLRAWMGVDKDMFYDESRIAIIPMGYCYPGRGTGGDLPPRRECAARWLDLLLARLPRIELTLLIGHYAQRHFLGSRRKPSLAATAKAWREYAPQYVPLPHPSPRNQPWFKHHPWFERQLVPVMRARIKALSAR